MPSHEMESLWHCPSFAYTGLLEGKVVNDHVRLKMLGFTVYGDMLRDILPKVALQESVREQ